MKKENKNKEVEVLTFEKALERLEVVVGKMESGKLTLDEMMKYFDEGVSLSSLCEKKLKELEKKIEILVKEDNQRLEWKEFTPSLEDNSGKILEKDKDSLL